MKNKNSSQKKKKKKRRASLKDEQKWHTFSKHDGEFLSKSSVKTSTIGLFQGNQPSNKWHNIQKKAEWVQAYRRFEVPSLSKAATALMPSDFDRLISGYRLTQTALLRDPTVIQMIHI